MTKRRRYESDPACAPSEPDCDHPNSDPACAPSEPDCDSVRERAPGMTSVADPTADADVDSAAVGSSAGLTQAGPGLATDE